MRGPSGSSGVDWSQALGVGKSLLFSPIVGFVFAGLLLLVLKAVVRVPALYAEPVGNKPPPLWIRSLLILTGTGVSFAHGSNDGQKGMGLILIGTVPTTYVLNKAVTPKQTHTFVAVAHQASAVLGRYAGGTPAPTDPRANVEAYVRSRQLTPATLRAIQQLTDTLAQQVASAGSIGAVPPDLVDNVHNNMYLVSEAIRLMEKSGQPDFTADDQTIIDGYMQQVNHATKFYWLFRNLF